MPLDGLHMIVQRISEGFTKLRGYVCDVHFRRATMAQRLGNAWHEQVRQHTRIQAPRARENEVCLKNRAHCFRIGRRRIRLEVDARFITLATLYELLQDGKIEAAVVGKAIKDLEIDTEKANPLLA